MLDFEKLFLRSPEIPREGGILSRAKYLQFIALTVWTCQGFCSDEKLKAKTEAT